MEDVKNDDEYFAISELNLDMTSPTFDKVARSLDDVHQEKAKHILFFLILQVSVEDRVLYTE